MIRAHHRNVFLIFCLAAILLAHKLSSPSRVNSTAWTVVASLKNTCVLPMRHLPSGSDSAFDDSS
jgi:hypothetical protein